MKQYLLTIFILILAIPSIGQNAAVSAGGEITSTNGTISFSVGQIINTSNNGNNGSVSHGVQQPFEISEITGIYSDENVNFDIGIYPNPTVNEIYVEFGETLIPSDNTFFQLFDSQGNILKNQKVSDAKTNINLKPFASGTYILRILQIKESLTPHIIKAFKIIKN